MSIETMYAWARPITQHDIPLVSNLDHTWVTTFETTVDPVRQPDAPSWVPPKSYWYCWGVAHKIASHTLGNHDGNIATAECVSPSNTHPHAEGSDYSDTSGSIEYYALDGVCHHVANQVLCATGSESSEPMRVVQAKGYPLSTFFYGTYGLNDALWKKICQNCLQGVKLPGDDFLPYMNEFVTDADKQTKLLNIRSDARDSLSGIRAKVVKKDYPYLQDVAEVNVKALIEVIELLGWETFKKLFPFTDPKDKTWMIQPTHETFR